ncbi:Calx-beta domain-containing protein [Aliishimia ponticola]|nr:Calx-beta domain-containing protein [Aliishimia ponticola]
MVDISVSGGNVIEFYNNYIEYTVSLSEESTDVVTVSYRTLRDTATDYDLDNTFNNSANNGTLTFAPGETSKTVLIEAESDSIDEFDENVVLELYNPSLNAAFEDGAPVLRSAGVILDDDGTGSNLAVFVSDPIIVEGDSGTKNAVFEVRLSQPASSGFSFTYTTFDITAEAGSDYTPASGTLSFASGQEVAYVSVPVLGDIDGEAAELFGLAVTPPANPVIGTAGAVGTATILDTDTSVLPEISIEGDFATEFYNNYVRFIVTLSEPSLDSVSVDYRTLRGTAVDYDLDSAFTSTANNGTLTFAPGQTSLSILIEAESDSIDEADEHFTLELFNPTANVVFAGGTPVLRSTGIIHDDDGAGSNLAVFVSNPVIVEADSGQTDAVFEIRLSQPATSAMTFTYTTADITATAGEDYQLTSGSVSFVPGQDVAAVRVPVLGDLDAEAAEKFALVVTPPGGVAVNTDGAVGEATLLDTDTSPFPEISIEGDSTLEAYNNYMRFTVTLSEPALDVVTVSYRTLRDTATDYDLDAAFSYTTNNGTLTFAPGQTTLSILIEAESDSIDEADENIVVELFDPSANAVFAGGTPVLRSTGIIWDDDGVGSNLAVFVSDPVLTEGDEGQTEAVFEIRLSQPASSAFTMTYATKDLSAIAGEDYIPMSGQVSFQPGQTLASVSVPVLGDLDAEAVESFALVVTPPASPSINTDGAVGEAMILDTDTSPLTEISVTGDFTTEFYNNYMRFVLTLSEPAAEPVTVSYRTLRDTAIDYDLDSAFSSTVNNGTVTFAPGQTSLSVFIEAENDTIDERDENITLELFEPSENAVFAGGVPVLRSTGVIHDNDGAGPNMAVFVSDPVVVEGGDGISQAVFEITLSEPAQTEITFDYETQDITTEAGSDYIAQIGTITFAPGQDTASVAVDILNDNAGEPAEQFALVVTPPPSPSIGTDGAVGVALILDTDTTLLPEVSIEGDVVYEFYNNYLRFVVTLSEPSTETVTIDYDVVPGSADATDLDNGLQSGTLSFAPGETTKSVFVEAEADTLDERDESIHLRLTNPVNAVFPQDEGEILATGFVLDDDGLGTNQAVAGTPTQVHETGAASTVFFVDVSLSRPSSETLTFEAELLSGTGTADTDIALIDNEVIFVPGATKAAVAVQVFGDNNETEGAETVELVLTPAPGQAFNGTILNTTITIGDGPAPVVLGNTPDILQGTPGDDVVSLLGGDDTFDALAGDDVIAPGAGDDNIDGGFGSDTIDYSDALGGVNVYLQFSGKNVGGGQGRDTFTSIENLIGSAFNDRLIGDSGDNIFTAGTGDDVVKGKGGDDTFYGNAGDDTLRGAEGVDIMYGHRDNDTLLGLEGDDFLYGGNGTDYLYGGFDSDYLDGGANDDFLRGNRGGDTIDGGGGDDDIRGGGNGDVLNGGYGDDYILGEGGGDYISGGAGDDTLFGGFGGGVFDGQRDTFIFASSADGAGGFDRIRDWEDGIDRLDLSAFDFDNFAADVLSLASNAGTAMRINFGGGDVIYIDNFQVADFNASDVIL